MYTLKQNSLDKIKSLVIERNLNKNLEILNKFRIPIDEDITGYSLLAFLQVLREHLQMKRNWDMKVFPDPDEELVINNIKNHNKEEFMKIINEIDEKHINNYWYTLCD